MNRMSNDRETNVQTVGSKINSFKTNNMTKETISASTNKLMINTRVNTNT